MSVIIDGMDMPANCVICPFGIRYWYQDFSICVANKGRAIRVNLNTGYDDSCPMRTYEAVRGDDENA